MNDITFSRALQSVMLDNKYDRFVKNKRTGKLNTRSLYKIEMSSKLFQKREARKNKHYAVSLVVDVSGSMSGSKIEVAAKSAQKLSDHLAKIGIPHNVVTFGISAHEIKKFNAKKEDTIEQNVLGKCDRGKLYEKYNIRGYWDMKNTVKDKKTGRNLYKFLAIAEGYNAQNEFEKKVDYDHHSYDGYMSVGYIEKKASPSHNTDAEALKFSRDLILKQTGRKIIIHLSDGQPAPMPNEFESPLNPGFSQDDFDLKHEVGLTLSAGVELYSIGILSDEVNKFYPPKRTGSISNIDQLYPHIIKLIRMNLRRG